MDNIITIVIAMISGGIVGTLLTAFLNRKKEKSDQIAVLEERLEKMRDQRNEDYENEEKARDARRSEMDILKKQQISLQDSVNNVHGQNILQQKEISLMRVNETDNIIKIGTLEKALSIMELENKYLKDEMLRQKIVTGKLEMQNEK